MIEWEDMQREREDGDDEKDANESKSKSQSTSVECSYVYHQSFMMSWVFYLSLTELLRLLQHWPLDLQIDLRANKTHEHKFPLSQQESSRVEVKLIKLYASNLLLVQLQEWKK